VGRMRVDVRTRGRRVFEEEAEFRRELDEL
jgi:hypothetical protein